MSHHAAGEPAYTAAARGGKDGDKKPEVQRSNRALTELTKPPADESSQVAGHPQAFLSRSSVPTSPLLLSPLSFKDVLNVCRVRALCPVRFIFAVHIHSHYLLPHLPWPTSLRATNLYVPRAIQTLSETRSLPAPQRTAHRRVTLMVRSHRPGNFSWIKASYIIRKGN